MFNGQPGYPPPQQGYAPQPQGYAPPPQGYAPQPQGYAPPPQGYVHPQGVPNMPQMPGMPQASQANLGYAVNQGGLDGFSLAGARLVVDANYIVPGEYVVRVTKLSRFSSPKDGKRYFGVDFDVLAVTDNNLGKSNCAGEAISWALSENNPTYTRSNLMKLLGAMLGVPAESISDQHLAEFASPRNPAGSDLFFLKVNASFMLTKQGKPFTKVNIIGKVTLDELVRTVPADILSSKFPGNLLQEYAAQRGIPLPPKEQWHTVRLPEQKFPRVRGNAPTNGLVQAQGMPQGYAAPQPQAVPQGYPQAVPQGVTQAYLPQQPTPQGMPQGMPQGYGQPQQGYAPPPQQGYGQPQGLPPSPAQATPAAMPNFVPPQPPPTL